MQSSCCCGTNGIAATIARTRSHHGKKSRKKKYCRRTKDCKTVFVAFYSILPCSLCALQKEPRLWHQEQQCLSFATSSSGSTPYSMDVLLWPSASFCGTVRITTQCLTCTRPTCSDTWKTWKLLEEAVLGFIRRIIPAKAMQLARDGWDKPWLKVSAAELLHNPIHFGNV